MDLCPKADLHSVPTNGEFANANVLYLTAKELIKLGANPNLARETGFTPIWAAAETTKKP